MLCDLAVYAKRKNGLYFVCEIQPVFSLYSTGIFCSLTATIKLKSIGRGEAIETISPAGGADLSGTLGNTIFG